MFLGVIPDGNAANDGAVATGTAAAAVGSAVVAVGSAVVAVGSVAAAPLSAAASAVGLTGGGRHGRSAAPVAKQPAPAAAPSLVKVLHVLGHSLVDPAPPAAVAPPCDDGEGDAASASHALAAACPASAQKLRTVRAAGATAPSEGGERDAAATGRALARRHAAMY